MIAMLFGVGLIEIVIVSLVLVGGVTMFIAFSSGKRE
jgi:hypothetical protein